MAATAQELNEMEAAFAALLANKRKADAFKGTNSRTFWLAVAAYSAWLPLMVAFAVAWMWLGDPLSEMTAWCKLVGWAPR